MVGSVSVTGRRQCQMLTHRLERLNLRLYFILFKVKSLRRALEQED